MGLVILFISGSEIVVVMLVVLILFGSKSIPGMARTFGKGMKEFRNVTQEIKNELETSTDDFRKDIDDVKNTVKKETKKITNDVKNVSDNVAKKTKEVTDEVGKEINTKSGKNQKKVEIISDKTDFEDNTIVENKKESLYGYDLEEPEAELNTFVERPSGIQKAAKSTSSTKTSGEGSKENGDQEDCSDFD